MIADCRRTWAHGIWIWISPVASAEYGFRQLLARGKSGLKVLKKKLVCVPAGSDQLVTPVQGRQFSPTSDKMFLPQAQITSVRDRAIRRGLF